MTTITPLQNSPVTSDAAAFEELVQLTLRQVAPSSARVYQQTYRLWMGWCTQNGSAPLDLRPVQALSFIAAQPVTKATRQRQLSALRKLAEMRYVLTSADDDRRVMEALRLVKAPVGSEGGQERARRALSPAEADRLLRVWDGERPLAVRNAALIAMLLMSGVRRSEAAALRWADVDAENGVLSIRHGKGGKAREAALVGDLALARLAAWQVCQGERREYVFCAVGKGGRIGVDQAISGTDVYRVWAATAAAAGVDKTAPHDARRTFITEALATGTPLATVQRQAGHSRGETTLRYAQAVDARRARKEMKLRYGE